MAASPLQAPDRLAESLATAGAARAARAALTMRLEAGEVSLGEVLDADDEAARQLKVVALLEALPGVGKVTARRALSEIGIPDTRRVQGLAATQRQALLARFGGSR